MREAISVWSGGSVTRVNARKADQTERALANLDYSCYEFLIWITDYSLQEKYVPKALLSARSNTNRITVPDYAALNNSIMWLANTEVMHSFIAWKKKRTDVAKRRRDVALKHFRGVLEGYGEDNIALMLERNVANSGPVFGLEIAIMNRTRPNVNVAELVALWQDRSWRLLRGCPEYLTACPYLKEAIEENTDGIYDALCTAANA